VPIGKLVKSNSHTDYICQIYGPGEIGQPASAPDYAFGTFVRIPLGDSNGDLVGLIYDTVLLNPEFGSLGPRLSPAPDLSVFSPDYLAEQSTLVGITAVGMFGPEGTAIHGVPPLAAQIDALVERMDDGAVVAFHRTPDHGVQVGYAPMLLTLGSPLARYLVLKVVEQLCVLVPNEAEGLSVLRGELTWRALIGPLGGGV